MNILCFAYVFAVSVQDSKISFPKKEVILTLIFTALISISILYNLVILRGGIPVLQFSVEIYMNISIFILCFILAKWVNTQHILSTILVAGVFFSFVVLYVGFFDVGEIRRIGNTELPISVNHLSHALVVSFTIGLCRLYFQPNNRIVTSIAVSVIFIAVFLTGSRSGFLGLGAVVVLITVFYGKDFISNGLGILIAGIACFFGLTLLVFDFTASGGLARISRRNLISALSVRSERYVDVIQIVISDPIHFFLGAGMDNYTVVSSDVIIASPHNIWLSFALFFGVPVAIIFSLLHISILVNGFRIILSGTDMNETTTALVLCLIVVSIYSFFSGRITRIFTIWVMMGLLLAQVSNSQSLNT